MATVPRYDNLQTSVSAGGGGRFSVPSIPGADAIAADQMQRQGQALGQASSQAARIMIDAQQEANQVRVIDALNQAKEKMFDLTYSQQDGFTSIKGVNALQRPDGKSLSQEYGDRFQETVSNISQGLGNDAQRRAFEQQASGMRLQLRGEIDRHMSNEFRNYQGSVYDGAIANAQNVLSMNYTGVEEGGAVDTQVGIIDRAVREKARLNGLSQEFADSQVRKAVSSAHLLAISAALEKNDPAFAKGYLQKYRGKMEADDILKTQGLIDKQLDFTLALQAAGQATTVAATTIMPTEAARAFNILIGSESGGRQFGADGQPLRSSAGAIGVAQVMEGTGPEAAKLAGLKWDRERWLNDEGYNRALGQAYFQKQLQNFGDLARAYAAYNAGPQATKDAIATAEKEGAPGAWLSKLPRETQAYVTNNMAAFQAGGGTPRRMTKTEVMEQAVSNLGPNPSPEAVRQVRTIASQQYETLEKDKKEADEEATKNAYSYILANGGTYDSLPASIKARVPAADVTKVNEFAGKMFRGADIDDPATYQVMSDPNTLRQMSDSELYRQRASLSEASWQAFAKKRGELRTGNDMDITSVSEQKSALIKSLGLKDKAAGEFQIQADKALSAAQQDKGRPLNWDERQAVLDREAQKGRSPGFPWSSSTYQFQATAKGKDFTPEWTDGQIREASDAIRRLGIQNPTRAQLEGVLREAYGFPSVITPPVTPASAPPTAPMPSPPSAGLPPVPESYTRAMTQFLAAQQPGAQQQRRAAADAEARLVAERRAAFSREQSAALSGMRAAAQAERNRRNNNEGS